MRPKTKDDAQKITLTLSAPARETLMNEALRRGVSRTQVVEDLVFELESRQSLLQEGKAQPQPHSGDGAPNILNPSAGGSKTPTVQYEKKRRAK